jgi:hypothetical protein
VIARGAQIRAARALLGWTRQELADAAGLHRNAVGYWESSDRIPTGLREPVGCGMIREALCEAGVELFAKPAPGVCFAVPAAQKLAPVKRRARKSERTG